MASGGITYCGAGIALQFLIRALLLFNCCIVWCNVQLNCCLLAGKHRTIEEVKCLVTELISADLIHSFVNRNMYDLNFEIRQ